MSAGVRSGVGHSSGGLKRKVLLMGASGSGKTSMRSIIFANYLARDTMRLGPTLGVENSHVRFLGSLVLNLWDCGGQDAFMDSYFKSQSDQIFRNVQLLIYVFDSEQHAQFAMQQQQQGLSLSSSSQQQQPPSKDMQQYCECIRAVQQHSPKAHVFVLIHKMDLIQSHSLRAAVFAQRVADITRHSGTMSNIECFATSIWDETLYKAWSHIVYSLIPNQDQLCRMMQKLARQLQADELVLFEKATFLVIQHTDVNQQAEAQAAANAAANLVGNQHHHLPLPPLSSLVHNADVHRFEKMSNIIKQFKLNCLKSSLEFQSMQVRNSDWEAQLCDLTTNTVLLILQSHAKRPGEEPHSKGSAVFPAATALTIAAARPIFEQFVQANMY